MFWPSVTTPLTGGGWSAHQGAHTLTSAGNELILGIKGIGWRGPGRIKTGLAESIAAQRPFLLPTTKSLDGTPGNLDAFVTISQIINRHPHHLEGVCRAFGVLTIN
tara:strand:+ start:58 stop:375 length:318 start_codon:yes stop_codon:yes gene_type:complete